MVLLRIYRKEILFVLTFAVLYSISFNFSQTSYASFVTLIPLCALIDSLKSRREALCLGYAAGVLQYLGTVYWLVHVKFLALVGAACYLGLYTAFFVFLAYGLIQPLSQTGASAYRFGWIRVFLVACLWVLVEYLRSNVPIMKFPWALLGNSQALNLYFIQSADIWGVYGISFVIVLVNACLYGAICVVVRTLRYELTRPKALLNLSVFVLIVVCFVGANVAYSLWRLDGRETMSVGPRIALIQGNIPQNDKWDPKIAGMIYKKFDGLSRQAALEDPDLIIWPETSFPGYWEDKTSLHKKFNGLIHDLRTRFLVGSPTLHPRGPELARYNSAVYLDEKAQALGQYHKIRLVPFGEYVPFLSWVRHFYDIAQFTPGRRIVLFKLPYGPKRASSLYMSILICFEDTFPDLCRLAVNKGSRLLVNLTNDAWFGKTAASYQHTQGSVFRAIENRVPVVRGTNTGLTCFIDPYGQIYGATDPFVTAYEVNTVRLGEGGTVYGLMGDIFIAILLIAYVIFLLILRHRTLRSANC